MIDSISNSNQGKQNQTSKSVGRKLVYFLIGLLLGASVGFYAGAMLMKQRAGEELAKFKSEVAAELEALKEEQKTAIATIYFFNEAHSLIPVTRTVTVGESIEKTLVLVQLAGLNSEEARAGLKTFISSNARLNDITVNNGVATLDIENLGTGDTLEKAKEQITSALKSLGIKQVSYAENTPE